MLGSYFERNVGQEVVDQLRFWPRDADIRAPSRFRTTDQNVLGQARDKGSVIFHPEDSDLATSQEVIDRTLHIGNLGVPEERSIKDRAAPVDHPNQQALRVFREALKPQDEGVMLFRQDRTVSSPDER